VVDAASKVIRDFSSVGWVGLLDAKVGWAGCLSLHVMTFFLDHQWAGLLDKNLTRVN